MDHTLADRIRVARVSKGLTQDRIAKVLGVSRAAVGQWERGLTAPSLKNLQGLEKLLAQEVAFGLGQIGEEAEALKPLLWREIVRLDEDASSGRDVPVTMATVGKYGMCLPIGHKNKGAIEFVHRPYALRDIKDVYAVAISSNSMSPRFEVDETIYVKPDTEPADKDYVILHLKDGAKTSGVRLVHLLIQHPDFMMVEQYKPNLSFVVGMQDVVRIDRVIPWGELHDGRKISVTDEPENSQG